MSNIILIDFLIKTLILWRLRTFQTVKKAGNSQFPAFDHNLQLSVSVQNRIHTALFCIQYHRNHSESRLLTHILSSSPCAAAAALACAAAASALALASASSRAWMAWIVSP